MNFRSIKVVRRGDTIFIPLPREAWRLAGTSADDAICRCGQCNGIAYWDTLAVSATDPKDFHRDYTTVVHFPELHKAAYSDLRKVGAL